MMKAFDIRDRTYINEYICVYVVEEAGVERMYVWHWNAMNHMMKKDKQGRW